MVRSPSIVSPHPSLYIYRPSSCKNQTQLKLPTFEKRKLIINMTSASGAGAGTDTDALSIPSAQPKPASQKIPIIAEPFVSDRAKQTLDLVRFGAPYVQSLSVEWWALTSRLLP